MFRGDILLFYHEVGHTWGAGKTVTLPTVLVMKNKYLLPQDTLPRKPVVSCEKWR